MKKQPVDWGTIYGLLKVLLGTIFLVNLFVAMFQADNYRASIALSIMATSGIALAIVVALSSAHDKKQRANAIQPTEKQP